jgi:NTP pyrophosphatase (non-canonical NTP hydrolase)
VKNLDAHLRAVADEVKAAIHKFPVWPCDPLHAVAILGEEFGELTKAVLQLTYEPHLTTREHLRKEAIQTAAMAIRFIASLSEYEYLESLQHEQDI